MTSSDDKIYRILFVCTGNTCRSPMAEGALRVLLQRERPGKFEVMSAGTSAADGMRATDYAVQAASVWNADISAHGSQLLTAELIEEADLILAMTSSHLREVRRISDAAEGKSFLLKNFPDDALRGEGVDDPIGQEPDVYNQVFLEIGEYLGKHLQEIVERIDEKQSA